MDFYLNLGEISHEHRGKYSSYIGDGNWIARVNQLKYDGGWLFYASVERKTNTNARINLSKTFKRYWPMLKLHIMKGFVLYLN